MDRALLGQRSVVLVVEDESLVRSTAMDMVEEAGFGAIAASDADEAIPDFGEPERYPSGLYGMFTCLARWTA